MYSDFYVVSVGAFGPHHQEVVLHAMSPGTHPPAKEMLGPREVEAPGKFEAAGLVVLRTDHRQAVGQFRPGDVFKISLEKIDGKTHAPQGVL